MASFRGLKRNARRDLHRAMQVPVLYLTSATDAAPVALTARVHTRFDALGTTPVGEYAHAAERRDVSPRIIFMRSELPPGAPARGHIVSVESGEAYRIDEVDMQDDITVTAYVVRMSATAAAGLPVPEAE